MKSGDDVIKLEAKLGGVANLIGFLLIQPLMFEVVAIPFDFAQGKRLGYAQGTLPIRSLSGLVLSEAEVAERKLKLHKAGSII
ncbi:MAG: hypothetical protein ABL925_21440 [Methylococcales bacterium]